MLLIKQMQARTMIRNQAVSKLMENKSKNKKKSLLRPSF